MPAVTRSCCLEMRLEVLALLAFTFLQAAAGLAPLYGFGFPQRAKHAAIFIRMETAKGSWDSFMEDVLAKSARHTQFSKLLIPAMIGGIFGFAGREVIGFEEKSSSTTGNKRPSDLDTNFRDFNKILLFLGVLLILVQARNSGGEEKCYPYFNICEA